MKASLLLFFVTVILSCNSSAEKQSALMRNAVAYDAHVHIMSPGLISYWKEIGIPFSKSDPNYSNVDTIFKNNIAEKINLIGMGYVYGNPEYYQGDDVEDRIKSENDYVFNEAKKYPKRIRPYFAIDPLKSFALSELERCAELVPKGGLKLHFNASQVYLTESEHLQKVKIVFEKSATLGIPILLHFDNWHPKFGKTDIEILVDSILVDIPKIELQIAHFGTSGGFNEKTKRFLDSFLEIKEQGRIPERHNIVFDISAVALDKDSEGISKLTDQDFNDLKQYVKKIGVENIVFGTDYPLYSSKAYAEILKEKVGFTKAELVEIMR